MNSITKILALALIALVMMACSSKEPEPVSIAPTNVPDYVKIPGVGSFIKQAVKKARRVNPNLTIGACNVLDCTLESVRFYRKTLKLDFLSVNYDQIFLTKLIDAQLNSK